MRRKSDQQFEGPAVRPIEELEMCHIGTLLGLAASRSTKTVMENHYFSIGGEIFKQRDGSPIGLDISVETASLYMSMWDRKLLDKLKSLGISVDLYKRYVDDIFCLYD